MLILKNGVKGPITFSRKSKKLKLNFLGSEKQIFKCVTENIPQIHVLVGIEKSTYPLDVETFSYG